MLYRNQGEGSAANPYSAPPADKPVSDKPAGQGPTPRKYAGKFNSDEELEKGYENQQTVLTERTQQLQAAMDRVNQLESLVNKVAERMSPVERQAQRSRGEQLLEAQGIPLDALDEVIESRVAARVPKAVESFMAPLTQGAAAQETLASEFPGISTGDVQQFLNANPAVKSEYNRKVKEDPAKALYYAYTAYAVSGAPSADLSGAAEARRNAGLPGNRGGDPRPESEGNEIADGWDKFTTKTGNVMDFLRPRLAHIIDKTR